MEGVPPSPFLLLQDFRAPASPTALSRFGGEHYLIDARRAYPDPHTADIWAPPPSTAPTDETSHRIGNTPPRPVDHALTPLLGVLPLGSGGIS